MEAVLERLIMDVATPVRLVGSQRLRALARANAVRIARAKLKKRVAYGGVAVTDVILDCPWEAHSMPVAELLMSQRSWGVSRSHKMLSLLPISDRKTLGALTMRQRHVLAGILISAPPVR
jgi:hypothetical protein